MAHAYLRLFFFGLLTAAAAHSAQAQQNFRPGYIVRAVGDTLGGEVDARGEQRMAKQCLFRAQPGVEPTRYAPTELKAYGVRGANYYEAGTLPADGGATAGATVFLRVVARGKAMLYAHPDADDRVHYYVRNGATPLTELVQTTQTVNTEGAPRLEQTYPFRQVLSRTFSDCPAVQSMLVRAELKESQLISIFNRYNTCGPGQAVAAVTSRKSSTHFGVVLGLQSATSNLNDEGDVALRSGLRPVIGVGMLFNPAAFNSKVGIRIEALYQKQLHEAEYQRINGVVTSLTSKRNARVAMQRVLVPLMLRYTFPNGRFRPYLQAGGEFALLLNRHEAVIERYNQNLDGTYSVKTIEIEMNGINFGATGSAGMLIPVGSAGALQLEARYTQLDRASAVYNYLGGANTLSFLLGYNFGH